MTSKTMAILTGYQTDPREVLVQIYDAVISGERGHPLPDDVADFFASKHDVNREWGRSRYGSGDDIEIECGEDSITVTFTHDDYCRGCYMGRVSDSMTIPDSLIKLFEDDRDEPEGWDFDAYPDALKAFVEQRAAEWTEKFRAEQRKKDAAEAARRAEAEAKERAEYERLREKFA